MEDKLSDILDNILGLLLLEGSYDIQDSENGFEVMIETEDAGRLIGFKGDSLSALQLIISQILSHQRGEEEFKRVILDVSGWRQKKEEDLKRVAEDYIAEVKETGKELELEPMPSWQRRIIHLVVEETEGVESESIGDGRDRHLVIRSQKS
jgi:spoIIIJ-associated protein